jgi:hypothetical protein
MMLSLGKNSLGDVCPYLKGELYPFTFLRLKCTVQYENLVISWLEIDGLVRVLYLREAKSVRQPWRLIAAPHKELVDASFTVSSIEQNSKR